MTCSEGKRTLDEPEQPAKRQKELGDSEEDSGEEEWEEVFNSAPATYELMPEPTQDTEQQQEKRRGIKRRDRIVRMLEHKVHLLCLLTSCNIRNQWCNSSIVQALGLSVMPRALLNFCARQKVTKSKELEFLKALVGIWRERNVSMESVELSHETLIEFCSVDSEWPYEVYSLLFVAACRALGFDTRLACCLQPIPLSFSKRHLKPDGMLKGMPIYYLAEIHMEGHEKWLIVDPITGFVGFQAENVKSIHAEPVSYVVAFESTFGCKDVTPRYTVSWGNTAVRMRIPERPNERGWWGMTLWLYSKSDLTEKDLNDDDALQIAETNEKMPTSFAGFQNHPLYVLERHLKQNEAVYPSGKEHAIGVYKSELVYSRKNVQRLASVEAWKREGRCIKDGEIEFKKLPPTRRGRQKSEDVLGQDEQDRRLFGFWQTEEFFAPEIVDGIIPVNKFGNIELFHENMLPHGAVHVLDSSAASVAKRLGVEYARAVVGFNHTHHGAVPILQGIVVANENEQLIRDVAYLTQAVKQHNEVARKKEREEREKRVIERWARFTIGLLSKDRLMREYMPKD